MLFMDRKGGSQLRVQTFYSEHALKLYIVLYIVIHLVKASATSMFVI